MNTPASPHRLALPRLFLALGSLAILGCGKKERAGASASAKEVYADTTDALANGWDKVKTFSFAQRDRFAASAKALGSRMEAQASKLRAEFAEAKASASRKAAMDELKNAEADYQRKIDALGDASAATWASAKQNAIAAWDRLEAAYREARAD